MKPRTTTQTAMICASAVLTVAVVTIPFESSQDTRGLVWLVLAAVLALPIVLGFRHLTTTKRAQIDLTGSQQYRTLADEYRRLADLAITAQEHTDLKLSEVSAQLDFLREQNQSLHKILKDVE